MAWRGVLLVALVVAGCAGQAPVPPGIPVGADGDALPTLHGTVVDEAIRPLAGATVRFIGEPANATTDADGRYEIRRPTLRPEAMLVTASMAGFRSRAQQAQVSGHFTARLDFVLEADPDAVAHMDVLQYRGSLGCRGAIAVPGQFQSLSCDPPRIDADRDDAVPWIWSLNPTPGFAGAVVEVDWEAESPATEVLHARIEGPVAGGLEAPVLAQVLGPSPLRLEVPAEAARDFPRWTAVRLVVELAPRPQGEPAAAVSAGQRFDALGSLFYVDAAPPGYTIAGRGD